MGRGDTEQPLRSSERCWCPVQQRAGVQGPRSDPKFWPLSPPIQCRARPEPQCEVIGGTEGPEPGRGMGRGSPGQICTSKHRRHWLMHCGVRTLDHKGPGWRQGEFSEATGPPKMTDEACSSLASQSPLWMPPVPSAHHSWRGVSKAGSGRGARVWVGKNAVENS